MFNCKKCKKKLSRFDTASFRRGLCPQCYNRGIAPIPPKAPTPRSSDPDGGLAALAVATVIESAVESLIDSFSSPDTSSSSDSSPFDGGSDFGGGGSGGSYE